MNTNETHFGYSYSAGLSHWYSLLSFYKGEIAVAPMQSEPSQAMMEAGLLKNMRAVKPFPSVVSD